LTPSKRHPALRNIFRYGPHQHHLRSIDPSANLEHVIISILGSIFLFPILVITTICCIRVRNIRAREKRIDDLAKKNRIAKGSVHNINMYAHLNCPCCVEYFQHIFQGLAQMPTNQ
jgi:hypothetical protein